MNAFRTALAFAAIPVFGNFLSGLLAKMAPVSQPTLSLALHAAGIMAAVVGIELMPEASPPSSPGFQL